MIESFRYETDEYGVIHQIDKSNLIKYDTKYIENYNSYISKCYGMSCLRIGNILSNVKSVSSVLDFGYGNGSFLYVCKSIGIDTYGYDISSYKLYHSTVLTFDRIFDHYFTVVTFFDSLEHIPDYSFISKLNCKYLVISAPECHWTQNDDEFYSWKHRKLNEHIHHFNKESCKKLINSFNFELINESNVEDSIRGSLNGIGNIFTSIFKKIV